MSLSKNKTTAGSPLSKKLTTIGLIIGGIGAAIIAAPVTLPAIVVTAGGYLTVAGGIIAALGQPLKAKLKALFM